jgi:hypothetical protein
MHHKLILIQYRVSHPTPPRRLLGLRRIAAAIPAGNEAMIITGELAGGSCHIDSGMPELLNFFYCISCRETIYFTM